MDARKVEVILEAIEKGSLKAAAEKNGYTPSGFSHLLQNLEEELGINLAERNNRGIAWSSEGRQLEPFLKDFVKAHQTLLREAENLREEAEAVVHIAAYASIAKSWMPGLVSEFRKKYPNVKVDIQVQGRQELYQNMADGRWNLIFACYDETCGYAFVPLQNDPFYAVLPPQDEMLDALRITGETAVTEETAATGTSAETRKASETAKTIAAGENERYSGNEFPIHDFEKYVFIMPSYGEDVEVGELLEKHDVHPQLLAARADDPVILGMVAGGMGISILSELVLKGSGENIRKMPVQPPSGRTLGIVHKKQGELSQAERNFLAFAADYIKEE